MLLHLQFDKIYVLDTGVVFSELPSPLGDEGKIFLLGEKKKWYIKQVFFILFDIFNPKIKYFSFAINYFIFRENIHPCIPNLTLAL